jgi:hypothetical protein
MVSGDALADDAVSAARLFPWHAAAGTAVHSGLGIEGAVISGAEIEPRARQIRRGGGGTRSAAPVSYRAHAALRALAMVTGSSRVAR